MHAALPLLFVVAIAVAAAVGYAFRGAIGREVKLTEVEAEKIAERLESGLISEAHEVAAQIRAKLAKIRL